MGPIGLEHFFDAFGLTSKRDAREAAAVALDIPLQEIQPEGFFGKKQQQPGLGAEQRKPRSLFCYLVGPI